MGIDRRDNGSADDGSFDDEGRDKAGGRDGRPDQGRAESPDHRAVPEKDRPLAEEERDRAALYADMRAEAGAEANGDGTGVDREDAGASGDRGRAEDPETRGRESRDSASRDSTARETGARDSPADHGPRPPDRDAPRTTDDGGWEWKGLRLGPEANRIADDAIAARRSAEGRDSRGNYGDEGITPAMRRVEASLEHGSLVPDTEKFALKGPDRFKEKLAKAIALEPDRSPSELSAEIHDGIRYTFLFDTQHYTSGIEDARHRLSEDGYELIAFKPSWDAEEYKGINSQWREPGSGQFFEVQFHTPESWEAKQKTHEAYEKIQSPTTAPAERVQLRAYQREISASIPVPPGALEFFPFKHKEG
jgi:hypothetical protein